MRAFFFDAVSAGADRQRIGRLDDVAKAVAARFWMGLAAAIPDARFSADPLIGRDDAGRPLRAAARWTIDGTHSKNTHSVRPMGLRSTSPATRIPSSTQAGSTANGC